MMPTSLLLPLRNRRFFLIPLGIVLLAAVALLIRAEPWRPHGQTPTLPELAAAQPDEFLIIVAPFQRLGEQPLPVGGTLARDLQSDLPPLTRVELLPSAPLPEIVPNLVATYHPLAVVTGSYNDAEITAQVTFLPPGTLATPSSAVAADLITLLPTTTPDPFQLYAPVGNDHPLRYLQFWLQAQPHFWRGDAGEASTLLRECKRSLPFAVPLSARSEMDRFRAYVDWQLAVLAGPLQANWQAARDLFDEAVRLAGDDPTPALGLAAAQAQLNQLALAEQTLQQTLRSHDRDWRIYYALAQIEMQKGEAGVGLSHYQTALRLLQEQPTANAQAQAAVLVSRGYQLMDLGEYAKAQADFQQALTLGRNDVTVQSNLGWAAYMAGDMETAVRASAAARQLAPDRPDLAFNEALHLLAAGQEQAARVAYDEAITLTLQIDDVLTRSTYFGVAYHDLADLQQRMPDLAGIIQDLQEKIDLANG